MNRSAFDALQQWRDSKFRKPLLIYGARQVGKTWLMKEFGKTSFQEVIYLNFEKEAGLRSIFEQDYNLNRILQIIQIHSSQQVTPGKTLLILDELQEARGALTSLKYFREEMPELHIIGAGSLLGIAVAQDTSFPVGQVDFVNLNPMNFLEFLEAVGEDDLKSLILRRDTSLIATFRERYILLLKQYYFVGGMPEAVSRFSENRDYEEVRTIQKDILNAYEQDFARHAPAEIIPRIRMIWNNVLNQLAKENKKFLYGLIKEGARAKEYELALSWIEDYGLVKKVYRTKKAAFPLNAYPDLSAFKLYILDVGLLGAMGNLSPKVLIAGDQLFREFKGALTEQYVFQQLNDLFKKPLHYWANDSGSAELDFIFDHDNVLIPLEVKAAENLQSKSLKTFAAKNPGIHCYRTSLSDYREEGWMTNVPLYMVGMIGQTKT